MSRKYRQRGYMDSDQKEPARAKPPSRPKRPLTPEERAHLRGVKRATAREAREVVRCPRCGTNVRAFGSIGPETACPQCRASLHCCRACLHFDPSARWECRAPIQERVADKLAANRCPHFDPRLVLDATGRRADAPNPDDPRALFNNLFKK